MSILPNVVRRVSVPLALIGLLATGAAGCSSTDELAHEFDQGLGDDGAYPGAGADGAEGGADEEPAGAPGEAGESDSGADSDQNDLPPAPDDEGVDNAREPAACDASADVTLYLSPDDSNSMSSPVQAREAVLGDWGSVQTVAIRTWEFFNYYTFDYPAAPAGSVRVSPSMMPQPGMPEGHYLLQVGVSSEALTAATRAPINVTLVLDTSGSMAGHPMDMLRQTCLAIAESLREGDTISIVTWNTDNAVVLGGFSVVGPNDPIVLAQIAGLEAGGSTDLYGGLEAGYALAEELYDPDRINRLVLVSDGGANAGITELDLIAEHSGDGDEDGIYMVGVGVGDAASYYDDLMDAVTEAGKGASVFIASEDDARSTFGEHFISTMDVAVRDVQVRLELPPGFEIVQASAEELSADPSEVEPQHLAPNDAMVFHQKIRTCAPELVADDTPLTVTVLFRDALTFEPREVQHASTFGELFAADPAALLKGAAVFTYAESLKAYKRADREGRSSTTEVALVALERAEQVLPGDEELAEIRAVLESLAP